MSHNKPISLLYYLYMCIGEKQRFPSQFTRRSATAEPPGKFKTSICVNCIGTSLSVKVRHFAIFYILTIDSLQYSNNSQMVLLRYSYFP